MSVLSFPTLPDACTLCRSSRQWHLSLSGCSSITPPEPVIGCMCEVETEARRGGWEGVVGKGGVGWGWVGVCGVGGGGGEEKGGEGGIICVPLPYARSKSVATLCLLRKLRGEELTPSDKYF